MAEQRSEIGDVSQQPVQVRREAPEVDTYEAFIDEIRGGVERWADAEEAAKGVLCALGMRLSRRERQAFESELHPKLAYFMRTCPRHRARTQPREREEFVKEVADHLGVEQSAAEPIVRAVFTAIRDRLPEGEVHSVAAELPAELADLFRRPV